MVEMTTGKPGLFARLPIIKHLKNARFDNRNEKKTCQCLFYGQAYSLVFPMICRLACYLTWHEFALIISFVPHQPVDHGYCIYDRRISDEERTVAFVKFCQENEWLFYKSLQKFHCGQVDKTGKPSSESA